MGYAVQDFTESLDRVGLDPEQIMTVLAAWGRSPDGYGSWEGGFLLALKGDPPTAQYLTGWCDTTGWGCQDGATVVPVEVSLRYPGWTGDETAIRAAIARIERPDDYPEARREEPIGDWDIRPADLNFWLEGFEAAADRPRRGGKVSKAKPATAEDLLVEHGGRRHMDVH